MNILRLYSFLKLLKGDDFFFHYQTYICLILKDFYTNNLKTKNTNKMDFFFLLRFFKGNLDLGFHNAPMELLNFFIKFSFMGNLEMEILKCIQELLNSFQNLPLRGNLDFGSQELMNSFKKLSIKGN